MSDEFLLIDQNTETRVVEEENMKHVNVEANNAVRLYKSHPNAFTLQIRSFGKLGLFSKAKDKLYYSSVSLTFEQIEAMYNHAKANQ